jgi:hypothetical protein
MFQGNTLLIEAPPDGPGKLPHTTCDVTVFDVKHHDVFAFRRSCSPTRSSLCLELGCILPSTSDTLPYLSLPVFHEWIVKLRERGGGGGGGFGTRDQVGQHSRRTSDTGVIDRVTLHLGSLCIGECED